MNNKEEGYVLIIVLWTVVILSIILANLIDELHLQSLLVKNNIDNQKNYQALKSGINRGIRQLLADESEFDVNNDLWFKKITGKINGIEYQVEIKDIGNQFNINYSPLHFLKEFSDWDEKFEETLEESDLFADKIFLKDMVEEIKTENKDYSQLVSNLNIYGLFNINTGRLEGLKKLMIYKRIEEGEAGSIASELKKVRKDHKFDSVEELQSLLNSLNTVTYDRIKPYLTTEPQININFASQKTMEIIFKVIWGFDQEAVNHYLKEIVEYRQKKDIEELADLNEIIDPDRLNEIRPFFSVRSRYFLIKSRISEELVMKVIVERELSEEDKWKIKIIKWNEEG